MKWNCVPEIVFTHHIFPFFETAVLPGETAILGGETAGFNFVNFGANLRVPFLQRISSNSTNSTMHAALGPCSV